MEQKYSPGVETLFLTLNQLFDLNKHSPLVIKNKLKEVNIHHVLYLCKEFGVDSIHLYNFVWTTDGPKNEPDDGFEDLGVDSAFNELIVNLNIYPEFVDDLREKSLLKNINEQIFKIEPLINSFVFINPALTKGNWVKLLASVSYLKYVSHFDLAMIMREVGKNQPNGQKYVTLIVKMLDKYKALLN